MEIKQEPEEFIDSDSQNIKQWYKFREEFTETEPSIKVEEFVDKNNDRLEIFETKLLYQEIGVVTMKSESKPPNDEKRTENIFQVKMQDSEGFARERKSTTEPKTVHSPDISLNLKVDQPKKEVNNTDSLDTWFDIPFPQLVPRIKLNRFPLFSKNFVCDVCYFNFPSIAERKRHKLGHSKSEKYIVTIKKRNKSSSVKTHSCTKCPYKSTKYFDMKAHRATHAGEKPFKCKECSYCSVRSYDLKRHRMIHLEDKPSICDDYADSSTQPGHVKTNTVNYAEKPFKCDQCDYSSRRSDDLKRHKEIHSRKEKAYTCEQCDYVCVHLSELKLNRMSHSGKIALQCEDCVYSCIRSYDMRAHRMIHSGVKPFKCDQCNYACRLSTTMRAHKLIHFRKTPLKCDECDFSCMRTSDFNKHKMIHLRKK